MESFQLTGIEVKTRCTSLRVQNSFYSLAIILYLTLFEFRVSNFLIQHHVLPHPFPS